MVICINSEVISQGRRGSGVSNRGLMFLSFSVLNDLVGNL